MGTASGSGSNSGMNGGGGSSHGGGSGGGAPGSSASAGTSYGGSSLSPAMMMDGSSRSNTSKNSVINTSNPANNTRTLNAGGGSGHKIAYDPLDLESRSEEAELPKLTLMEEIILLGIKECV